MTQEQREAMDRLHMYKTSSKYTEKCEVYGLNGDALCNAVDADRELLSEAFIAEHMADDAEPVTEDWFRSTYGNMWVGIEPVGGGPIVTLYYDPLGGCDGWSIGKEMIPPMETRGQLRRLIAALKGE